MKRDEEKKSGVPSIVDSNGLLQGPCRFECSNRILIPACNFLWYWMVEIYARVKIYNCPWSGAGNSIASASRARGIPDGTLRDWRKVIAKIDLEIVRRVALNESTRWAKVKMIIMYRPCFWPYTMIIFVITLNNLLKVWVAKYLTSCLETSNFVIVGGSLQIVSYNK
jgi:hypothetical protein